MAERSVTTPDAGRRFRRFVWEGLKKGDTGAPVSVPGVASMYFQVIGVTSGIVAIEGSLEEVAENYFIMREDSAMPVYLRPSDGVTIPYPGVMHVRPRVDDGDEGTELTVILFTRST